MKTAQDYLQILWGLPGWVNQGKNEALNLATGTRVIFIQEPELSCQIQYPGQLRGLSAQGEIETFVALQEAQALAIFPQYWVATFFWKTHKDDNGTRYEGGYDTVYTDRHPTQLLEDYRAVGHTAANLVCFSPITKAQYETERARIA